MKDKKSKREEVKKRDKWIKKNNSKKVIGTQTISKATKSTNKKKMFRLSNPNRV